MQTAGLLRRFGAIIYDILLVAALLFLATVPFIALRAGEAVEPGDNILYQLTLFTVVYVFFVGFWTRKGRTLGMQSWGLQLEAAGQQKATLVQATIRFFAAALSWLPFGLGYWWQLWDKDRLAWHDRLSGTRLVYYPRQ
ncbi:MAG: RDD family protein [Woeseiaceae bacterium]|nr:RDD family protein [Woeseiaceae bacterium]